MKQELSEALESWNKLNEALRNASEEQCHELLDRETCKKARLSFLNRIHGAYNKRRFIRERLEIAKAARN